MVKESKLKHIGFIMDGNGRWAVEKGLTRLEGHKQGLKALENLIKVVAEDKDLMQVSFYCFSTENWDRPAVEVKAIMALLKDFLVNGIYEFWDKGIEVRINGNLSEDSPFDDDIRELLVNVNNKRLANPKLIVSLCINYGGHDQIVRATNSLINKNEEVTIKSLNKEILGNDYDLDLIVRTSGEQRLSNFLLWQSAYSEILFVDYHWPDMDADKFKEVKEQFANRDRRFGKL
jgi:undecaprenyl diphosphate synthase